VITLNLEPEDHVRAAARVARHTLMGRSLKGARVTRICDVIECDWAKHWLPSVQLPTSGLLPLSLTFILAERFGKNAVTHNI
jgi:hypothetical protein